MNHIVLLGAFAILLQTVYCTHSYWDSINRSYRYSNGTRLKTIDYYINETSTEGKPTSYGPSQNITEWFRHYTEPASTERVRYNTVQPVPCICDERNETRIRWIPSVAEIVACTQRCPLTSEYLPVCGTDGITYTNPGRLLCHQFCGVDVKVKKFSPCPSHNLSFKCPTFTRSPSESDTPWEQTSEYPQNSTTQTPEPIGNWTEKLAKTFNIRVGQIQFYLPNNLSP